MPAVGHELHICEIPPTCESPCRRWDFWQDHFSASPTPLNVVLLSFVEEELFSWLTDLLHGEVFHMWL